MSTFREDVRTPAALAFVCEGDAERDAFSGTAKRIVEHLRAAGHEIHPINVRPPRSWLLLNAALTVTRDRSRWRARFRYGDLAFGARSSLARAGFRRLRRTVDVVLQIGAAFEPPCPSELPFAVYCDWNMSLSIRYPDACSATTGLSVPELRRMDAKQRLIYQRAARVFTFSEKLRRSFITDYQISPDRVIVAYPGANVDVTRPPTGGDHGRARRRRVLFVGYEFERKGGDVLLEAFRTVRHAIPDASLTIIGPSHLAVSQSGVQVLGRLRQHVPQEREQLVRAFEEADVFCLPTRLDPFPTVVREAMSYGLPCVTSDVWAMSEMVVDGETGFTVPAGDATALAARLVQILRDDSLQRRLGLAGRVRAEALFTWPACARVLHQHIEQIRAARSVDFAPLA